MSRRQVKKDVDEVRAIAMGMIGAERLAAPHEGYELNFGICR